MPRPAAAACAAASSPPRPVTAELRCGGRP